MTTLFKEGSAYNETESSDIEFMDECADATLNSMKELEDTTTGIPNDRLVPDENGILHPAGPASFADFGVYGQGVLAMEHMGKMKPNEAEERLANLITQVAKIPRYTESGLPWNWTHPSTLEPALVPELHSSAVDLSIYGFVGEAIVNAHPKLRKDWDRFLATIPFHKFIDPQTGLIHGKIDSDRNGKEKPGAYFFDVWNTDGMLTYLAAKGIFNIPEAEEGYRRMGLLKPANRERETFTQHPYGMPLSWDGTAFEPFHKDSLVPISYWAGPMYRALGDLYMGEQIEYGNQYLGHKFGFSSCYVKGKYVKVGVRSLGMSSEIKDPTCMTPHGAGFALLTSHASAAVQLFRDLRAEKFYNDKLGFPASIDYSKGLDKPQAEPIIALFDQGALLGCIDIWRDRKLHPEDPLHGLHRYTDGRLADRLQPMIANYSFGQYMH